ncbi:uncharacterized protein LOC141611169 isoform X4 [Silene latifolia]|uniref:uncharacterized protein LOC141611169 isoform X4 n=1 Tax=Silene latifolia TaxID=37657 RepID=UPI003D787262
MDLSTSLSVVQTILTAIQTLGQLQSVCSISSCKSELDDLQNTVEIVRAVLMDADAKQDSLNCQEQVYVKELKDAVYDADDVLDEFLTLAKQKQLRGNKRMGMSDSDDDVEDGDEKPANVNTGKKRPSTDAKTPRPRRQGNLHLRKQENDGVKALLAINNKTRKENSIEDLSDEILLEILSRLPRYVTALRCKTVSKRWCSLISDPSFPDQGFSIHQEQEQQEQQPWTSLEIHDYHLIMTIVAPPFCESLLWSPSFSLNLLPNSNEIHSTFRDLVLYSKHEGSKDVGQYYVSNLLTKQWITLPPFPTNETPSWAGLVGRKKGADFRVVVAHYSVSSKLYDDEHPLKFDNLFIYLSESGEWKRVTVEVATHPDFFGYGSICGPRFSNACAVVCKSMVCFCWLGYFGALDPFQVTPTSDRTLTATKLPSPPVSGGKLLESCGKLISMSTSLSLNGSNGNHGDITVGYPFLVWKLDLKFLESIENRKNNVVEWELVSKLEGCIADQGSLIEQVIRGFGYEFLKSFDVHPNKEHLVYLTMSSMHGERGRLLFICDTRLKCLKVLPQLQPCCKFFLPCHSLLQGWPTPISIPEHHR